MVRRGGRYMVALAILFAGARVFAQEVQDTLGTHVVQPGETLTTITAKYLGDSSLWRENWRLNPQVENPNLLRPGEELVVITNRVIEAEQAKVQATANKVDKNLRREDWVPAEPGDELQSDDGLRTLARSSAELAFNDNSMLRLGEYSQVFLESREVDLRGVDRGRVELERGSAELVFAPIVKAKQSRIELVAGDAIANPEADRNGNALLRAATDDNNRSRFMVLEGISTVEASGAKVAVAKGEGTVVEAGQAPTPPEKLLAAPTGLAPPDGDRWLAANQRLSWNPVTSATEYMVEICRDPECGQLLQTGRVQGEEFEAELFDAGEFFWRVRAIASSGLEGFPSAANSFRLDSAAIDRDPPIVAVMLVGGARRQPKNEILIGPGTKIRLHAYDEVSGVDYIEYRNAAGDWTRWADQDLEIDAVAWPLAVRAADRLGHVSSVNRTVLRR